MRQVVELVDKGQLRTAEPVDPAKSEWKVNEWVKRPSSSISRSSPCARCRPGNWSGTTRWRSSTATRSWACASYRTPWRATAPTSPRVRSSCRRTSTSAPMSTRARWSTRGPRSAPAPRSASTSTYRAAWASAAYWNPCRPPRSSSRTTASSARVRSWSRGRMSAARRCSVRTPSSPARRTSSTSRGRSPSPTRVTCRRVRWSSRAATANSSPRANTASPAR